MFTMSIEKLSCKKFGQWLLSFLVSFKMVLVCMAAIAINSAYVGIKQSNNVVGIAFFGAIVCFLFAVAIILMVDASLKRKGKKEGLNTSDITTVFLLFGIPTILVLIAPFVYIQGSSKVFVVDGQTTLSNEYLLRQPFSNDVQSVKLDQPATVIAISTTKDNVQVQGHITGDFKLIRDEESIKHLARPRNPDKEIQRELQDVLQKTFDQALAQKNLNELSNNLVLEFKTGQQLEPSKLGVKLQGVIKVSDLHAYFNK